MVRPALEARLCLALIALAGCSSKKTKEEAPARTRTCDVWVTMGNGSASATVDERPRETPTMLEQRAVRTGCQRLCQRDGKPTACAAKCEVDVQAKKAGARVLCKPPLPR